MYDPDQDDIKVKHGKEIDNTRRITIIQYVKKTIIIAQEKNVSPKSYKNSCF